MTKPNRPLDTIVSQRAYQPKGKAPKFELIRFRDIRLSTVPFYLVKGVIPRAGLVLVWGPPKCGKSFWSFDVGMHIALGWEYRGRRVKQGPVVYLAAEGAAGFPARKEAWRSRHLSNDRSDPSFHLIMARPNLIKDHDDLISCVRDQIGDETPAAVFIDTLNKTLVGSESSDQDMTAYTAAAEAVQKTFRCAVVIVHHCGKDDSRPRGHTSLTGAVDAQIAIEKRIEAAPLFTATVEYLKDGPPDAQFACRLEQVEVALDDDGDPITSCVVVPTDAPSAGTRRSRLTPDQELAKRWLADVLCDSGMDPPFPLPAGLKVVERSQWRDRCYLKGFRAGDTDEAKRQAFGRAVKGLMLAGAIAQQHDKVWLTA